MNSKTFGMFLLIAILAVGISINMGTVFAGGDESYEVKQKVEIEQDCDQKNVNEDSEGVILTNGQTCTAIGLNLNYLEIEIPLAGQKDPNSDTLFL